MFRTSLRLVLASQLRWLLRKLIRSGYHWIANQRTWDLHPQTWNKWRR